MNNHGHNDLSSGVARHFSGVTFNSTVVAAIVAIALAGIVVLSGTASVITSAFAGGVGDQQPKEVIDRLVGEHSEQIKKYQDRFKNRYVFFKPPPRPVPTPARQEKPPPVVVETPRETGPPAVYPGSSVAWVIGDDVYFNLNPPTPTEKYMRIKVGEERNGHKVINIDKMPRTVRVGHSGGEYDVKVFGESTATSGLFPTTPKPSILVPGFIPAEVAGAQPAVAVETDTDGDAAKAIDVQVPEPDANANAAIAGEEQPRNRPEGSRRGGDRRRSREGGTRGERQPPPGDQPREATDEGDQPER